MKKIVSGGQAGADLAGIDWAIKNGVPREIRTFPGFKPIGSRGFYYDCITYIDSPGVQSYVGKLKARTSYNVQNSGCTLIFLNKPIDQTRGSKLTLTLCRTFKKEYQVIPVDYGENATEEDKAGFERFISFFRETMKNNDVVNIAGPRDIDESAVRRMLDRIWVGELRG